MFFPYEKTCSSCIEDSCSFPSRYVILLPYGRAFLLPYEGARFSCVKACSFGMNDHVYRPV